MPTTRISEARARQLLTFAYGAKGAAKRLARHGLDPHIPAAEMGAGARKGRRAFVIQSLLFPMSQWTLARAQAWCQDHGYHDQVDVSGVHYRFRQRSPEAFKFMRTIALGREGAIKAVGGRLT